MIRTIITKQINIPSMKRLGHTACLADVERVCCVTAAEQIRFTSILSLGRDCGVVGLHLICAYSVGSVTALIC